MAKAAAQFLGVFEGIDFPPYEYQHYPLMMTKKGEGSKIVESEEEQAEAEAADWVAPKVGKPKSMTEAEVEALESKASKAEAERDAMAAELAAAKAALAAKATGQAPPAPPKPPNPAAASK